MKIKIKHKITIMGREIIVEFDKHLIKKTECQAMACYREDKIKLMPVISDTTDRTEQHLEIDYLHELVHWMLHLLKHKDLDNDENFVGRFSELLYQIIKQL